MYDEYQYNLGEITHNPYHLISYLTAKYGDSVFMSHLQKQNREILSFYRELMQLLEHPTLESMSETE